VNIVNIEQVAATLTFVPVTKRPLVYTLAQSGAYTYRIVATEEIILTFTSDGLETTNTANIGDYVFSGPSGEQYVLTPQKVAKNYTPTSCITMIPEQSPRLVAQYRGQEFSFIASFGQPMPLKDGDFLVKDGDQGYYRIAQKEFLQTYNWQ